MKRSIFGLLTTILSVIAIALFSGSLMAQGNGNGKKGGGNGGGGGDPPPSSPFNYRIEFVDFHLGNAWRVVAHTFAGTRHGFAHFP